MARALALLWGGWWTFFGLASGLSEGLNALGVLIHTIVPGLIFLVIALSTFRWEFYSAGALVVAGLAALIFFFDFAITPIGLLTIVLPPILAAVLLLLAIYLQQRYAHAVATH